MRTGRLAAVAFAALMVPQLVFATHVPSSSEKVTYKGSLSPGVPVTGSIGWKSPTNGYDWYCMNVTKGQAVTLTAVRTSGDLRLNLGAMSGVSDSGAQSGLTLIKDTSNSTDPGTTLTFTSTADGPVTIWVSTFLDENGGNYTLTMTGGSARAACTSVVTSAPVQRITVGTAAGDQFMGNGETIVVPASVTTTSDFASAINFLVIGLPGDVQTTFAPSGLDKPGRGDTTLTISTSGLTVPATYPVSIIAMNADNQFEFGATTLLLTVTCDPPKILGTKQPQNQTIAGNANATLNVAAAGSGPMTYQWFSGWKGSTAFPVAGATKSSLTTNQDGMYWVRVGNACGSTDSETAILTKQ